MDRCFSSLSPLLRDVTNRYLIEDYALHYAASAAVLEFTEKAKRPGVVSRPTEIWYDTRVPHASDSTRSYPA
jgi:hypothetical protein